MQTEPIRVLMVIGRMGLGGAEAMIMNLYRKIDRDKIQFDFLVHKNAHGDYEDEILSLGGKIYRIDKYNVKNYFSYVRQLKDHFRAHPEHKIVHCHIGSAAAVCLKTAKKFGAYTIAHSHSTRDTIINSYPTRFVADHFFACSKEAAVDRFGKKVAESDKCDILYNGIDCDRFTFNRKNRDWVRKELALEENFVVGSVGRHTPQKNPIFLLEVFAEIYRQDPNARLLQVGEGEMTEQMKQKCREKYYSAMDVFLFPSLWEGLGMVAVEAQTNGLHVVTSDAVPILADVGAGLFHVMNLKQSAKEWAVTTLSFKNTDRSAEMAEYTRSAGYDINGTAKYLSEFYYAMIDQNNK